MIPTNRTVWTALLVSIACTVGAEPADAQYGQEWVRFEKSTHSLGVAKGFLSNNSTEVDFAWGDMDQDGDIDLVVVRKEPFTSPGKRTNVLLINESGVLLDRTNDYAVDSDVSGDLGFRTPTNDRDAVVVDLTGDTALEVVTATTISDGDPKHIGHPRVYLNRGGQGSGWLGLRFEDGRIPQLLHFGTGNPENPRFCSVAAGDVTSNGFLDLYFGDYDSSGAGGAQQQGNQDLNDRLLINDGTGHFTDQSQLRMSTTMLSSAFGTSVEMADINQDGVVDIVKDTALNAPQYVAASYNDPANPGTFNIFDSFHTNAPYHIDLGDLNNDGRLDVVVSDDATDRYRFNTGVDALGRVTWSSSKTFDFLTGNDDGFASNNLIVDLDGDGWNDVLVCDVDVDINGCTRRLHVYHNLGGTPGSTDIVLREEREKSGGGGWMGVSGLKQSNLQGAHDVAVFDIDGDKDMDMVVARCVGTTVWLNTATPQKCQDSLGMEGPGLSRLKVCGHRLAPGNTAYLAIHNAPPKAPAFLALSYSNQPTPLFGGTIVPFPPFLVIGMTADSNGVSYITGIPGGGGPISIYAQAVVVDALQPQGLAITNAVELEYLP